MAWVHPGQATSVTDALLEEVGRGACLVVSALWPVEVANALLVLERRKKLKRDERLDALATLQALNVSGDEEGHWFALTKISELAEQHGLSAYDVTCLELALREHLPLVTKDKPLREAATRAGALIRGQKLREPRRRYAGRGRVSAAHQHGPTL